MSIAAAIIAQAAHVGQLDKQGVPYILHPMRVASWTGCYAKERGIYADPESLVQIAWLHDVVENTALTLEALRELRFGDVVIAGVDAISRRESETYREYIERLRQTPVAKIPKIADIYDNLRTDRPFDPVVGKYEAPSGAVARMLDALVYLIAGAWPSVSYKKRPLDLARDHKLVENWRQKHKIPLYYRNIDRLA